jgi:hypothetical protein
VKQKNIGYSFDDWLREKASAKNTTQSPSSANMPA